MAINIPTLDAPRVQSQSDTRPVFENTQSDPRASPAALAFGAIGDALSVAQKFKRDADAQAALEAHNSFQAWLDAGQQEVKNAEGKNAALVAQKFEEDADKKAKEIFGSLPNSEQKQAFSNAANASLLQANKVSQAHVGEQVKISDINETNSANANDITFSDQNIHVSGIAEARAQSIEDRIYGTTVDGKHVPGFAERHGVGPEKAKQMRDELVGRLYASKAARLLNEGDLQGAQDVVMQHQKDLGDVGAELLGQIKQKARLSAAEAQAVKFTQDRGFLLPDGNVNTTKADLWVNQNKKDPAEQVAFKLAIQQEAQRVRSGLEAKNAANSDAWLGDYSKQGRPQFDSPEAFRAFWEVKSAAFHAATNTQKEAFYQKYLADQREKAGQPMNDAQRDAFGSILWDVQSRPEFWGSADMSDLKSQTDYQTLPDGAQKELIERVAQTQQDKGGVYGKRTTDVALQRAQEPGHPLAGTAGKKYDQLDPDQQESFHRIHDGVLRNLKAWRSKPENQKAAFAPDEVIRQAVDDVTRTARVESGRFFWPFDGNTFFDQKNVPIEKARKSKFPIKPDVNPDEDSRGREVLRRQGVHADEMTPEKITAASRAKTDLAGGPDAKHRVAVVKALQAQGIKNPDESQIQETYESTVLHYDSRIK